MSLFVLDCSIALAWWLKDETNDYADSVLKSLETWTAVVPALWPTEFANGLVMSARRGRMTEQQLSEACLAAASLCIEVRPPMSLSEMSGLIGLAHQYDLTAYDAAYLHLALAEGLALATLDRKLAQAAAAAGVAEFAP